MKKVVRLTESDIENLIRKVLLEYDTEYEDAEEEGLPFAGYDVSTEVFDFLDLEDKLGEKVDVDVIVDEFREDLISQAMEELTTEEEEPTLIQINDRVNNIAKELLDERGGDNAADLSEQDLDTGVDTSSTDTSTSSDSGGGGTGAPGWESGLTRGRANPLQSGAPYDTGLTRAYANPLQSGAPWETKVTRGKGNPTYM